MFGYVIPDKPNMFMKDYYNYKAYYCGLCKSIGEKCGQCMRFTTNYDVTFLNILAHAVKGIEPVYHNEACILSPKKKQIVVNDDLTKQIVDINTLLTNYKLIDDKEDGGISAKAIAKKLVVNKRYKKARAKFPELDLCYNESYSKLRKLELENCESADRLADPFATMLKESIKALLNSDYNEYIGNLLYNIGRWVYFMDAIDDIEEDYKKKQFNPFLVNYNFVDKETFLKDKGDDLDFLLMSAYNNICDNYNNIEIKVNEGVLTNILWYGILSRTKEIFGRTTKCKRIRI